VLAQKQTARTAVKYAIKLSMESKNTLMLCTLCFEDSPLMLKDDNLSTYLLWLKESPLLNTADV
jgi:hypothetical protein